MPLVTLNSRQRRTLERVFARPTPADIRWSELESLLRALGVEIRQGSGSRVRLSKGPETQTVHKPHPGAEVSREAVRQVLRMLTRLGVSA